MRGDNFVDPWWLDDCYDYIFDNEYYRTIPPVLAAPVGVPAPATVAAKATPPDNPPPPPNHAPS